MPASTQALTLSLGRRAIVVSQEDSRRMILRTSRSSVARKQTGTWPRGSCERRHDPNGASTARLTKVRSTRPTMRNRRISWSRGRRMVALVLRGSNICLYVVREASQGQRLYLASKMPILPGNLPDIESLPPPSCASRIPTQFAAKQLSPGNCGDGSRHESLL